jgi:IS30 family transposase
MDQGISSMEVCRIVGINRRNWERWCNGRQATGSTRGAPPMRRPFKDAAWWARPLRISF